MIPDREIPFKVSESILRTWNHTTCCRKILRPAREDSSELLWLRIQFDVVSRQNIAEQNYDDFELFCSCLTKAQITLDSV